MDNPAYFLFLLIANLSQLKDRKLVQSLFIDGMREISGNSTCQWCDQVPSGDLKSIEICTRNASFGYFSYLPDNNLYVDMVLLQNACQMIAVILEKLLQEQGLEQLVSKRTAELEAANRELEESRLLIENEKERLIVTLHSIGDGVITTDTSGRILMMNRVAEELTGWTLEAAYNKPLTEVLVIVNELTREKCANPADKVLERNTVVELSNHTILISRDGTERVIADSGAPILDVNNVILGVVLVFRDMTEKQKLLENAQRTDKLESIGLLAGGIAHDFNNLLSGLFGYIDLALGNTNDPSVSKYLEKALDVFNRARDLTRQLLTFSKGGAPIRKTGNIGKYVRDSVLFALSGSSVICEFSIAEDLNECDFDENQIGQVVDNIVINAIQAMTSGGALRVGIRNVTLPSENYVNLQEGNYIVISVTDTGIGIPPSIINRIFDPFFTTKKNGNGLGLATCFSIVKKHDGTIHVESELGKGSTFFIYLPSKSQVTRSAAAAQVVKHHGNGLIVIMDDEEFILEILGRMLTDMGYEVVETRSGEELLAKVYELEQLGSTIKAGILDLTIPGGMGGRDAVKKLREKYPVLPVFASSGFSEDPVMASPGQFGFTASICKPYRKFELATLLNSFFGESGTLLPSPKSAP
jgi:PAS domain S-box-containing protein